MLLWGVSAQEIPMNLEILNFESFDAFWGVSAQEIPMNLSVSSFYKAPSHKMYQKQKSLDSLSGAWERIRTTSFKTCMAPIGVPNDG